MSKRASIRALLLLAAILGARCAGQAAPGQGVSFEVRTKDGRSEYRIGEPIALQLVFTSSSKQYLVDTSFRYPDIQRQPDEFLAEPMAGSSDPLEDYRRARSRNEMLFDRGGLRGYGRLGEKPVTLDLFLNRYVRFSKPGRYILSIRDRRVSLAGSSWNAPAEFIELMSKPLILTIAAPSAEWQQQQLDSALEALKKRPGIEVRACETLMSLGTLGAEMAMVEALEDEYEAPGCGFAYGLLAARNRKSILERMQEKLESPTANMSSQFVETMASLMSLEDARGTDFMRGQSEARRGINNALFTVLKVKQGRARIAAISTLVNESLSSAEGEDLSRGAEVLRLASEVFEQLSAQAQSTLLSARWSDVGGPAMVPVLRRCAEADGTVSCGLLQGDLLLARLNELSPADARGVVLADMQKENPRFPTRVLAILADQELPEMDAVLREHLLSNSGNLDTTAGLIQRYATTSMAGAVTSFLDENGPGKLGGDVEANLIAYLFRVQPDSAEQRLRAALAVRNGTGWYKYLLGEVAQRTPSSKIQGMAIDSLSDPDHEVVTSAVQALALAGDEQAKIALYQRLGEWRAKWMGHERDMLWIPGDGPITDDRYLGDELIQSIATGAGWLLTAADQRQLLQSAITENQKQQVDQFVEAAKARPVAITVINASSLHVQIIVGQYSYESAELAKRKLAQFPASTVFQLQSVPPESAETRNTSAELPSLLKQRGMRWEVRTER